MVKDLVQYFYNIAKEHKLIKSFKYDQLTKSAGTGEDVYPLFFLEDPIYYNETLVTAGTIPVIVNIDIVFLPQALENYNVEQLTPLDCQNLAHSVILNMIAKIREDAKEEDTGIDVTRFSFLTLRHWYDDNASGMRVTLRLSVKNDIWFCDVDEHFDENKTIDVQSYLQDIPTDDAEGCSSTFEFKLPDISL